MPYFVYILKCVDKSFYVGSSANLRQRLMNHKEGFVKSTKNKRPVKLSWYCCFINKEKALQFEKYLKIGSGFAFSRKRLI